MEAQQALISDGVRDTPPQLPLTLGNSTTPPGPIFFVCNAEGSFDPSIGENQPITTSCAGGGRYFNNFENVMSYHRCPMTGARKKTFTPGQISRSRCVWRCFRAGECGGVNGGDTFPF